MVDSVERANMTHNWVNYMREIIENDIECIIYNAKRKGRYLYVLEKYLLKNTIIMLMRKIMFIYFQGYC